MDRTCVKKSGQIQPHSKQLRLSYVRLCYIRLDFIRLGLVLGSNIQIHMTIYAVNYDLYFVFTFF